MISKVTATGIIIEPGTPNAYLMVEISVSCPECGPGTIRIPGHHLKAVRDICQSYVDQNPELTGGRVVLVDSTEIRGTVPKNPENN